MMAYLRALRELQQQPKQNEILTGVLLSAILIVATYLRFWTLRTDSLWLDEAVSWMQSRQSLWQLMETTASDNYPPLHNLVLFVMIRTFGDSEVALRFPSALFGVANVAAIYWLGAILNNRLAGLLAALLLALSGFHIWYSQEARMYTLLALTATLFAATSARYMQSPTLSNAIWSAVTGVALLYSHFYGMLTWGCISAAVFAIILMAPKGVQASGRHWLLIQGLAGAAFLPWALILLHRLGSTIGSILWIPEPSLTFLAAQLTALASTPQLLVLIFVGALTAFLLRDHKSSIANEQEFEHTCKTGLLFSWLIGPPRVGLVVSLLLLCFAVIADNGKQRRNNLKGMLPERGSIFLLTYDTGFLFAWLVGPALIGLLSSIILQPVFLGRYLLGSLPAGLLLASIGFTRLARGAGVAIVALLLITSARFGSLDYHPVRSDWRDAALLLAQNKQPGDCVVTYPPEMVIPLRYYYRDPIPCLYLLKAAQPIDPAKLSTDRLWILLPIAIDDHGISDVLLEKLRSEPWQIRQQEFGYWMKVFIVSRE